MSILLSAMKSFCRDDSGSQVVEYALIIALVSIVLALALGSAPGLGGSFAALVTRVTNCLQAGGTCT